MWWISLLLQLGTNNGVQQSVLRLGFTPHRKSQTSFNEKFKVISCWKKNMINDKNQLQDTLCKMQIWEDILPFAFCYLMILTEHAYIYPQWTNSVLFLFFLSMCVCVFGRVFAWIHAMCRTRIDATQEYVCVCKRAKSERLSADRN